MIQSVFDAPVFRSATFKFKVAEEDFVIDDRGNKRSSGREIFVTFYMRSAGGSSRTKTEGGAIATATYNVYVIGTNHVPSKKLPEELKAGDIGEGTINGQQCTVKLENLTQSSIIAVNEALGDRAQITATFITREGVA